MSTRSIPTRRELTNFCNCAIIPLKEIIRRNPALKKVYMSTVICCIIASSINVYAQTSYPTYTYTDTDSGVSFTVPEGWYEKEFLTKGEYLDAKFANSNKAGVLIMFGGNDLWSAMEPSERIGLSRADLNNSYFTVSYIAEMLLTTPDKVKMVTYNQAEYYRTTTHVSMEISEMEVASDMTYLTRIDNGWLYMFQFSGTTDSEYYSDFEALLSSTAYPTVSASISDSSAAAEKHLTSSSSPGIYSASSGSSAGAVIFLVISAVLVAAIIFTAIVKRVFRPATAPSILFCRKCGARITKGSNFCTICGTKVINYQEEKL